LSQKLREQVNNLFGGGYPAMPASWDKNHPETVVVVTVVGTVVVAIRDAAVPGIVVPTAATQNAVRAFDC
jgi:hypothetical protein